MVQEAPKISHRRPILKPCRGHDWSRPRNLLTFKNGGIIAGKFNNLAGNLRSGTQGSKSTPKSGETKPKLPGSAPANGHDPIPIDLGPVSECFDHDPKLLICEMQALGRSGNSVVWFSNPAGFWAGNRRSRGS